MTKRDVVDYCSLRVVQCLVFLMGALPRPLGMALARLIVKTVVLVIARLDKVADANLSFAFPELSATERKVIYHNSLRSIAYNLWCYARIPYLTDKLLAESVELTEARKYLQRIRERFPGKGILFATCHYGDYELMLQCYNYNIGKAAVLARGFGLPRLDAWWIERRERRGALVFKRKGGFAEAISYLSRGIDVIMLCDQNVKANYAVFAPFFGKLAATTKTPALIAMRIGCPVIFGAWLPTGDGRNIPVYEELIVPDGEELSNDEKIRRFATQMNSAIEKVVRRHPELWYWVHRRFKTRPPGEAEDLY